MNAGGCGFRGKPITIPKSFRSPFQNEADHDSGVNPITHSDFKPITFTAAVGRLFGIISEHFPQGEGRWTPSPQSGPLEKGGTPISHEKAIHSKTEKSSAAAVLFVISPTPDRR